MKYKVQILRKPVKYLRIKVIDHTTILATAPLRMSEAKISDFIKSKATWIQKQVQRHKDAASMFSLGDKQVLLHGEAYTTMYREGQGKTYTIDHKKKFIWWGFDLLDTKQQLHRYKTYAKKLLPQRLEQLSKKHGISYNKCFVRDQKTKRGSCSSKGHIGLNWRLIKAPGWIMDYVICHELAHRQHMNHSQAFRDSCAALFPKTKEARLWLKKYGRALH